MCLGVDADHGYEIRTAVVIGTQSGDHFLLTIHSHCEFVNGAHDLLSRELVVEEFHLSEVVKLGLADKPESLITAASAGCLRFHHPHSYYYHPNVQTRPVGLTPLISC